MQPQICTNVSTSEGLILWPLGGVSSDLGFLEQGAAVGISNPVLSCPAEADCSVPASSLKAGGQNWPVSDWRTPHSMLFRRMGEW